MSPLRATTTDLPDWDALKAKLRLLFGETVFKRWLEPLALKQWGTEVVLALPTRFMKDWVDTHYADKLKGFLHDEDEQVEHLTFIVEGAASSPVSTMAAPSYTAPEAPRGFTPPSFATEDRGAHRPASLEGREDMSSPLDPRFTFESFVVGKPNELAYAAARRVAEASQVSFNPLFLYGGVGLGKTHLMHAIAWHIRKSNPTRRVMYLSAEKFMYQFVRALRFKDTMAFK